MAGSLVSGPVITAGSMMDSLSGSPQNTDHVAGPNIEYHGNSFADVRYYPMPKDNLDNPGVIPSVVTSPESIVLNAVPSTAGTGNIAVAQPAINGVALSLATGASVGLSINIPFQNFATKALTTGAVAIDLGIETPTVVSGSKTVTIVDSSVYRIGQPIIITAVGAATGTNSHLFTYITGIPTATTITIADTPLASNSTTTRICSGLPGWANTSGAGPIRPTFYSPYIAGGAALAFDPTQAIERGVSIAGNAGSTGGAFTLRGADIYGQLQSEVITVASGATTASSKKCYKIIQSVIPSFADSTHTYAVQTTDLFGFPFRSDFWEMLNLFIAGTTASSQTGWTKGDKTSPATTTTGDPRGTYSLQSASNGVNRLVFFQTLPFLNLVRATPSTPQFLYGVTPV